LPDNPPSIDKAGELQVKWNTERGQLWLIPTKHGEHRLLCGDSTLKADVDRVMGGDKAELLVTDPPYNVGIEYGHNVDDVKHAEEYEAFSRAWFEVWRSVSKFQIVTPGYDNLYVWCRLFEKPYHVAPWTKTNSMTRGHVSRFACFEPVMFYGKGWKRVRANDVFDFPISAQTTVTGESLTKQHPCPKPLSMWIDIIENYTDELEIVVDAFGGSGTTMVACEQTGRLCRMIEIEPKYVAVILERITTLGLEPRLSDS
jgi:DNA modification methylase